MNTEQENRLIKNDGTKGCLLVILIIISIPVVVVGFFVYEMEFKETTLKVSHSPNGQDKIKVTEKGEPAFFGGSTVRIHYRDFGRYKHEDHTIANDGKALDDTNVSVDWETNTKATVTLKGEEQMPERIQISFKSSYR